MQGAGRAGAGRWVQARVAGVRTGADKRGRVRARAGRACVGRHAGRRASAARGAQEAGRARQGARGRTAGRHAGRGRFSGHGRPGRGLGAACARRLGQLGQVGVLCTLTLFFGPVRLGIFPDSLNELHCKINFSKKQIFY